MGQVREKRRCISPSLAHTRKTPSSSSSAAMPASSAWWMKTYCPALATLLIRCSRIWSTRARIGSELSCAVSSVCLRCAMSAALLPPPLREPSEESVRRCGKLGRCNLPVPSGGEEEDEGAAANRRLSGSGDDSAVCAHFLLPGVMGDVSVMRDMLSLFEPARWARLLPPESFPPSRFDDDRLSSDARALGDVTGLRAVDAGGDGGASPCRCLRYLSSSVSTAMKVPVLPTPAEQCTRTGASSEWCSRCTSDVTVMRPRTHRGSGGMSKSGQSMY